MKKEETRRITDIQALLTGASADQLDAPLQRTKEGKYLITPAILEAYGLTVDSSGTIQRKNDALGARKVIEGIPELVDSGEKTGVDATWSPSGSTDIYEVLGVMGTYVCDAGVADRAFTIRMNPGYHGNLSALPSAKFVYIGTLSLQASEQGSVYYMQGGDYHSQNDNGTVTLVACSFEGKIFLYGTAGLICTQTTNKESGDKAQLQALVRQVA